MNAYDEARKLIHQKVTIDLTENRDERVFLRIKIDVDKKETAVEELLHPRDPRKLSEVFECVLKKLVKWIENQTTESE